MRRNLDESVKFAASIQQKYLTAAGSPYAGTSFDTVDYDDILVVYSSGTHVTNGTCDVHIEESDDNSSFTDITGAVFTQVTDATDEATYIASIRACSTKRYIRAYVVVATADVNAGVYFVGNARQPAVTQDFTSAFTIS